MSIDRLLKIYEDQSENLDELFDNALQKQKAVINNQREGLERFTNLEEQSLSKINRKEHERENCVEKLLNDSGKTHLLNENVSSATILSEIKLLTDADSYNKLFELRRLLKEKTMKIGQINKQNMFLIEQANSIVKQTLNILLTSQKKPILDRRV
jgi:hypothetical protein